MVGSGGLRQRGPDDGVADIGIAGRGGSFAFGLTVLTRAYTVGHISGGHFNPAVTLGLVTCRRHDGKELLPYRAAQVVGAVAVAVGLYVIASGAEGFAGTGGFATNGYHELSRQGYSMTAVLVTEVVMTAVFLIIILGATSCGAQAGFAPIVIGLGLTLVHLISIPINNIFVKPARSTGVALFAETAALGQLWLFWVAPLVGAAPGGGHLEGDDHRQLTVGAAGRGLAAAIRPYQIRPVSLRSPRFLAS